MSLRLGGGRKLRSPQGNTTRPTTARVRQAVFNILGAEVRGAAWLDLFSGSGVMACEALRHGASRVEAVELDRRTAAVARQNQRHRRLRVTRMPDDARNDPPLDLEIEALLSWPGRGRASRGGGCCRW